MPRQATPNGLLAAKGRSRMRFVQITARGVVAGVTAFLGCAAQAAEFVRLIHASAYAGTAICVAEQGSSCSECIWTCDCCSQEFEDKSGLPALYAECQVGGSGWCEGGGGSYASVAWNGSNFACMEISLGGSELYDDCRASFAVSLSRRTAVYHSGAWQCCYGSSVEPETWTVLPPGIYSHDAEGLEVVSGGCCFTYMPLPLDVNGDGLVDAGDLSATLAAWGELVSESSEDTNLDGRVDAVDVVRVLSGWGGDGRE